MALSSQYVASTLAKAGEGTVWRTNAWPYAKVIPAISSPESEVCGLYPASLVEKLQVL